MIYILDKAFILCRSTFHKNILSGFIYKKPPVRNNGQYPYFKKNTWAELKLKTKDNVSNDYNLVYKELLSVNRLTITGYYMGWIGLAVNVFVLGYFIYEKKPAPGRTFEGIAREEYNQYKPLTVVQQGLLWFAGTTVAALLVLGSRMLPFRIYHNPKEKMFKAVFLKEIFRKNQVITFSEGTIVPVFKGKTEGKVFYNINGRIVLLDPEFFPVPYIHEQMLHKTK